MAAFDQMMHELEDSKLGKNRGPSPPRMFGNGAQEYFDKYGANINHLAQIGGFYSNQFGLYANIALVSCKESSALEG